MEIMGLTRSLIRSLPHALLSHTHINIKGVYLERFPKKNLSGGSRLYFNYLLRHYTIKKTSQQARIQQHPMQHAITMPCVQHSKSNPLNILWNVIPSFVWAGQTWLPKSWGAKVIHQNYIGLTQKGFSINIGWAWLGQTSHAKYQFT
jgi:hypothetical protein